MHYCNAFIADIDCTTDGDENMRRMDENARLREIFEQFDEILWEYAQAPFGSLATQEEEGNVMEKRAVYIGKQSQRIQEVIAAYFNQQTAMMQGIMKEARFSKFPLPRKRIGLWTRIKVRLELWKAIRSWPFREQRDS